MDAQADLSLRWSHVFLQVLSHAGSNNNKISNSYNNNNDNNNSNNNNKTLGSPTEQAKHTQKETENLKSGSSCSKHR